MHGYQAFLLQEVTVLICDSSWEIQSSIFFAAVSGPPLEVAGGCPQLKQGLEDKG